MISLSAVLLILIIPLIIGGIASINAKSKLNKYRKVPISLNIDSAFAVRNMLSNNNCDEVQVNLAGGDNDYYNPKTNSITLSHQSSSITDIAVACHEAGHAVQMKEGYNWARFRMKIFPLTNLASSLWVIAIIIGGITHLTQLYTVGIALFCVLLVWELVNLPLEFNASNRAIQYITSIGASPDDVTASKKVLNACAMTYVAAVLISILNLIYLLMNRR